MISMILLKIPEALTCVIVLATVFRVVVAMAITVVTLEVFTVVADSFDNFSRF